MKWGASLFSKNPIIALKENKKKALFINFKKRKHMVVSKRDNPSCNLHIRYVKNQAGIDI